MPIESQNKTFEHSHQLLEKLKQLKENDIIAIELDVDGCLINGCIRGDENSINEEQPLNTCNYFV